jgi:hypothetical protein
MSKHAGALKWIAPDDPSLGEDVLGACKKVLSDVKSESKCTIESDQRMC